MNLAVSMLCLLAPTGSPFFPPQTSYVLLNATLDNKAAKCDLQTPSHVFLGRVITKKVNCTQRIQI